MLVEQLYDANAAANNRGTGVSIEKVLESFSVIEKSLYESGKCQKSDLEKASSVVEAYIEENPGSEENFLIENKFKLLVECYIMTQESKPLNEWIQRGFDSFDDTPTTAPATLEMPGRVAIKKVLPWCSNSTNKIVFKDGRIFAGKRYSANDIIEEAPIRVIQVEDTYSRPIRDLTFEIDGEKGLYAIPFGYASYYRIDESSPKASYDFVYEPKSGKGYVVIRALTPIMKDDEITIIKDRNRFSEQKYDRFRAANGLVREVPVTNFRFN